MATNKSNSDSTTPKPMRTTIRIDYENGAFHATEPASDRDLVGRGETRTEAVRHYCNLIDDINQGETA